MRGKYSQGKKLKQKDCPAVTGQSLVDFGKSLITPREENPYKENSSRNQNHP